MYLVTAEGKTESKGIGQQDEPTQKLGGLALLWLQAWRWWRVRGLAQQRRKAKKQLFLLETMVLGPKQRVVLMRCGEERFLVGTGAEGVTSVVRVDGMSTTGDLPLNADGDESWG
jgi:flagellar biogenesis protein FliO